MKDVHDTGVVLFISLCGVMFSFLMLSLFGIFIDWWLLLVKFYVFDIFDVVGQRTNDPGVDTVLKAEGFSKGQWIIMRMYLYSSRCIGIKLNNHLNRLLLFTMIVNIQQLILERERRIEYFFNNSMRLTKHDLNSNFKTK